MQPKKKQKHRRTKLLSGLVALNNSRSGNEVGLFYNAPERKISNNDKKTNILIYCRDNVWRSSTLSLKIKLDIYTSLIVSTAIAYTPVRLGRVQLEYVSSWTSSTSGIYGRFWALRGRTT